MKVPTDVKTELTGMATAMGIDMEMIKKEFGQIVKESYLAEYDIDERCRQAAKILKARMADSFSAMGDDYDGIIVHMTVPKEIDIKAKGDKPARKAKIANIYGIFAKVGDKSKPTFAKITCWDDATETLSMIELNKSYKMKLNGGLKEGYLQLSLNNKIIPESIELNIPPLKEVVPKLFRLIRLSEASLNTSKGNELKMVRGRVRSEAVISTKLGTDLGLIKIIDDTVTPEELKKDPEGSEMTIMCDPSLVKWEQGSDLYFIGVITMNDKYPTPSMRAELIVPILGIEKSDTSVMREAASEAISETTSDDAIDLTDF